MWFVTLRMCLTPPMSKTSPSRDSAGISSAQHREFHVPYWLLQTMAGCCVPVGMRIHSLSGSADIPSFHSGLHCGLSALNPLPQEHGHTPCAPQCCKVHTPPRISLRLNEWYTLALLNIYTALQRGDRRYCFMARKIWTS